MSKRQIMSIAIDENVMEKLKSVVARSPGWTLGEFVSSVCSKEISALEKKRGDFYPPFTGKMRRGTQGYMARAVLNDLNEWLPKET